MAIPVLRRVKVGTILHRVHRPGDTPLLFGPSGSDPRFRFDSPDGGYKVLYAARALETAFGETLVRSPNVPYVTSASVSARVRSELTVTRGLKLYPLIDAGVSAHGLSFTELHADPYAPTWELSAKIHRDTAADGLLFASRFDNQRCVALFDRAADAIAVTERSNAPISPAQAVALADHFGKIYVEP